MNIYFKLVFTTQLYIKTNVLELVWGTILLSCSKLSCQKSDFPRQCCKLLPGSSISSYYRNTTITLVLFTNKKKYLPDEHMLQKHATDKFIFLYVCCFSLSININLLTCSWAQSAENWKTFILASVTRSPMKEWSL